MKVRSRMCHDWQIRIKAFKKVELSMNKFLVSLSVLTLASAVGCTEDSSEGPQATAPRETRQAVAPRETQQSNEPVKVVANKPVPGEADKTFSLSVPFDTVKLTQGEEKSILIGINRGENFREEVAIEVSDLPEGVTLETAKPVIETGDTDVTLLLKATPDAAVGDFTFKVTGSTTSSGADFTQEVKLTVAQ